MDDIFEQMLSTSPWRDGVGVNRGAWDGSVNNMAIDPPQSLSKVPPMALNSFMGGLSNQGLSRALQESSAGMHPDGIFEVGHVAHIHVPQNVALHTGTQGYVEQGAANEDPAGTSSNVPAKPRVRARRGQATDPHSIAERNRRERIAERLRALQELVPDSNKTDKASMLDEIIGYVKFLQMQVKCLSMCRLGGAGAAVPLLADLPSEGASNFLAAANLAQAHGALGTSQEGMATAERQVAQLMDEDMSAAMQYLQSKGLCLMPISLATAISSTGARQQATPSKLLNGGGSAKQTTELAAASSEKNSAGKGGENSSKPIKEVAKEESSD
ncbi:hypothetical protein KP509_07G026100 [Ceratopteris richardii]|uniref:BHLH domain-containing protein n=1 Tax=Ceratopteris richardii TaxID=49495 RepID=A0A8T2UF63_CERRI|nr:hypothetical protein KP509_07G026100 [Ceratopteris richardii]KAH7432516.1 hypothetical protein KP509_07G026100 [Ceratopteris richardii]